MEQERLEHSSELLPQRNTKSFQLIVEDVLENIRDGFYALDREWRFVYVNHEAEILLQRSREDLIGKNVWNEFPEAVNTSFYEKYHKAVAENIPAIFEDFYAPLDAWILVRAYPSPNGLSVYTLNVTERKRAEISARESNQKLQFALKAGGMGSWELDLTGGELIASDTCKTNYGRRSDEEFTYQDLADCIVDEDRAAWRETVNEAIRNGLDFEVEYRVRWRDNSIHWVLVRGNCLVDKNGKTHALTGISVDITTRKKTEQNLLESEARFRNMADDAPVMIWVTDASGYCTFLSQSWYDFTGQTPETGLGFGWIDAVHPDESEIAGQTFITANEKQSNFSVEYRFRRKDGEYRWTVDSAQPRFSETGEFLGYIGSVVDIHERKQIETALRDSEEKFRDLANSISQLAWMADASGYLFWYNQRWLDYTGTTLEEMLGWKWQTVHHPDEVERVTEKFKRHIASGEIWEDTFPLRSKTGEFRWFLSRALPIRNEQGQIVRWFGTNTDIEELRQARLQAEQANELKDDFLATLSHELRTPLNAILGWSKMLQTTKFSAEETEKALATIERNARAQNQLIDDLLDVSRIITGKLRLDARPVDLSNVITAAVDAGRPAAEAKSIELHTILDSQIGIISGDSDRLQQIVWNLLSNAIKFTPKHGRVEIKLEKAGSQVEVIVSDTGKGIETEFLPFVFDRFRQSDGSMTRRHGGLGLGLSIVRQLVELHGGTVSVNSDGEGRGATFKAIFPVLPIKTESPNDEPQTRSTTEEKVSAMNCPPELSGLQILLVDDEDDSRNMLNLVLDSCGAKVMSASSAAEAFSLVQNEKFDVIISDIGMPEENGFALITKIRKLPDIQGGSIPAVALTAYAREEDKRQAIRSGFQIHISKPVDPSELVTTVANLAARNSNGNS